MTDLSAQERPEEITEILGELERYWRRNPDQRLGQIISDFSSVTASVVAPWLAEFAVGEITDDLLLQVLRLQEPPTLAGPVLIAQAYAKNAAHWAGVGTQCIGDQVVWEPKP